MGVWLRFFDFSGDEKGNKPDGIDGMFFWNTSIKWMDKVWMIIPSGKLT